MISLAILLLLLVLIGSSGALGWRSVYYRLLRRDMDKWRRNGWVSETGAEAILAANRPQTLGHRLVFLIALLGALLLLFAAISFIAANWEDMSRLARLTWLIALMWTVYLVGWRLHTNGLPLYAEAAITLGVGLFGGNIALIAQMFHIDSHPPSGVLMWTMGALASALLLNSRAALILTFIGAITWSMMEVIGYDCGFHWPYLLVFLPAAALAIRHRWAPAYHLAFLSLLLFAITNIVHIAIELEWTPQGVMLLFVMLFLFLLAAAFVLHGNVTELEFDGFETWVEKYAVFGLLVALFALHAIPYDAAKAPAVSLSGLFDGSWSWLPASLLLLGAAMTLLFFTWRANLLRQDDFAIFAAVAGFSLVFALLGISGSVGEGTYELLATWVFGAAYLAFTIWLMVFGYRRLSDAHIWAALIAFAAEVLYVYFRIFGTLLETSLFFFTGGVLTLALAFFLYRLYQRLETGRTHPAEVGP